MGPREVEGRGEEGRVPLDGGVGRERVGKVAGGVRVGDGETHLRLGVTRGVAVGTPLPPSPSLPLFFLFLARSRGCRSPRRVWGRHPHITHHTPIHDARCVSPSSPNMQTLLSTQAAAVNKERTHSL